MSKTPCKGIRKDGSPCQGNGLDQFDGHCIAHAPADLTHEWRSLGGKNSATAARIDKRMPERLKGMIDTLDDGMKQVMDGTLSPAQYTAICRGVKMMLDVYRQADEEMDLIRTEETHAAAAQLAGAPANPDILAAADTITAKLDQYRAESLAAQGFAELKEPANPDQPPQVVLNDRGRRRFGYHNFEIVHLLLSEVDEQFNAYDSKETKIPDVHEINELLDILEKDIAETPSRLARNTEAPFDPLTGQPFTAFPARVEPKARLSHYVRTDLSPQDVMEMQLSQIRQLKRIAQELSEDEDYIRRRAEIENHNKKWDETMAYIEADKKKHQQLAIAAAPVIG